MSDSPQVARKHHYVPQFYFRAWLPDDGEGLWVYKRDYHGAIRAHRRHPGSVGFVEDLYALRPEMPRFGLPHVPDALEKGFFEPLDDKAALVHQKLLMSGTQGLTDDDRSAWALFLNSLMERHPTRIAEMEDAETMEELRSDLSAVLNSDALLGKVDFEAMYRNAVRHALIGYIADQPFVEHVVQMRWRVVDCVIPGEHWITGDSPLLVNSGVADSPVQALSLAISPTRLMIMADEGAEFDEQLIRTLAAMHNVQIVRQTKQSIVSSRALVDGPFTKFSKVVELFPR